MKKILGILGLLVLISSGCGNKGEIRYNGIYELDNAKIKTYLKDDIIYYAVKNETIENNGSNDLNKKKNIIKIDALSDDAKLTFKNDKVVIKTSNEYFKSGDYEYSKPYSNEEFYNDFYGDKKYANSEINGVYVNGDVKVYVYQKRDKTIRLFYAKDYKTKEGACDFEIDLDENGVYHLDFFESVLDITFEDNTMTIYAETEDEDLAILDGTYKKDSDLKLDDIIKNIPVF